MRFQPLTVPGSQLLVPTRLHDSRGSFHEVYRAEELAEALGYPITVEQANISVSACGVLRGIHATRTPPGQAKIVTCHRGAILDVVVDIRLGSPTYGRYASTVLRAEDGNSIFIAAGLGHAFRALADDTCVGYLCSAPFVPGTQIDINPFDPELAIDWGPADRLVLSEKDRAAPALADLAGAGLLPSYAECCALYSAR
jgi:NDP-hexose 5-epimerase